MFPGIELGRNLVEIRPIAGYPRLRRLLVFGRAELVKCGPDASLPRFHLWRGPMRRLAALILVGSFLVLGGPNSRPMLAAPAGASDLDGTWKLVVLPYGDDEFLVFEIKADDGKL